MYRLILPQDLRARLAGAERPAVVDLRDETAFASGHLPGAALVPAGASVERWIPQRFSTTGEIVLYDAGGGSTVAAREATHLSHLWYQGILVLRGGFAAWRDAGFAVEQGPPVDPLDAGRHLKPRMPPPGVVPDEYAPRE